MVFIERMKFTALFTLSALLSVAAVQTVQGQVSVSVVLDQDIYLSGEAVIATVEITNLSGQTIQLGESPNWLEFSIESKSSNPPYVNRLGEMDMSGTFELGASMTARRSINILPYFEILKSGLYEVVASVHLPYWDGTYYISPKATFNVFNGVEILGFDVGVPKLDKEGNPVGGMPEVRHYGVIQVAYLDKMRLYVRISSQNRQVYYKVVQVCGMLSFSDPRAMIDPQSNLHILNQIHAKRFIYFVCDPNGTVLKRHFYDYYNGSRPRLAQNEDGSIVVRGGMRMQTSMDYPPTPAVEQPPSIVTLPGDSITNAVPDLDKMTKEEKKRYKEEQDRIKKEQKRLEKEQKKLRKAAEED